MQLEKKYAENSDDWRIRTYTFTVLWFTKLLLKPLGHCVLLEHEIIRNISVPFNSIPRPLSPAIFFFFGGISFQYSFSIITLFTPFCSMNKSLCVKIETFYQISTKPICCKKLNVFFVCLFVCFCCFFVVFFVLFVFFFVVVVFFYSIHLKIILGHIRLILAEALLYLCLIEKSQYCDCLLIVSMHKCNACILSRLTLQFFDLYISSISWS